MAREKSNQQISWCLTSTAALLMLRLNTSHAELSLCHLSLLLNASPSQQTTFCRGKFADSRISVCYSKFTQVKLKKKSVYIHVSHLIISGIYWNTCKICGHSFLAVALVCHSPTLHYFINIDFKHVENVRCIYFFPYSAADPINSPYKLTQNILTKCQID